MLSRYVALFLAAFLFCCGLTSQESGRAAAASVAAAQVEAPEPSARPRELPVDATGHQVFDDAPAPVQAEAGSDVPALVPHIAGALAPAMAMSRPAPHRMAAWVAPTLDGLRRPPRAARALA